MVDSKEILITRMYAGEYQETNNNLGHEFINLFKTDSGENYIYVNSSGGIGKEHQMNKIHAILLVQWIEKGKMEVIAKAEDLIPALDNHIEDNINQERQEYNISKNKICYGNKQLDKILDNNKWVGGDGPTKFYFTYKVGKVTFANKGVMLNQKEFISKNFPSQQLKWFYSQGKSKEYDDYCRAKDIIDNPSNWMADRETESLDFSSDYIMFLMNKIQNQNFTHMMKILEQRIKS